MEATYLLVIDLSKRQFQVCEPRRDCRRLNFVSHAANF